MTVDALVGFVGVALGAASTSILTIYKERFIARREREAWQEQQRREREEQRNIFQRESVLALQSAVSDLVKSVYDEQDRMLVEMEQAKRWPVRRWETPTAAGWADAEMRLEMLRVRIFDGEISSLPGRVRAALKESVWATNIDDAKRPIRYWSGCWSNSTTGSGSYCRNCTRSNQRSRYASRRLKPSG